MPTKKTTKPVSNEREVPLIWDFPEDLVSGYATNIMVQLGEHELFVSFFEMPPPVLFNPKDIEKLESVKAECIVRLVILPERLATFIDVLQRQLDLFNERKRVAEKTNGAK